MIALLSRCNHEYRRFSKLSFFFVSSTRCSPLCNQLESYFCLTPGVHDIQDIVIFKVHQFASSVDWHPIHFSKMSSASLGASKAPVVINIKCRTTASLAFESSVKLAVQTNDVFWLDVVVAKLFRILLPVKSEDCWLLFRRQYNIKGEHIIVPWSTIFRMLYGRAKESSIILTWTTGGQQWVRLFWHVY